MSYTIVVGVDASPTALMAAQSAARLAAVSGARLHVVSAFDKDVVEQVKAGSETVRFSAQEAAKATAMRVASEVTRGTSVEATSEAVLGKPHQVLIEAAERLGATLIVVGNRNMQGAARVLGSVANSVAHNAPCDVYIVKTT